MNVLKWEEIHHDGTGLLFRAKVHGGWLVRMIEDVRSTYSFQSAWRPALTFVPDPNHEWVE